MKFLSAPWRWDFISSLIKKKGCVFCDALKLPEKDSLICFKGKDYFVILNKYPYNTAHVMIVPYVHVDTPDKIAPRETIEMWELMNRTMAIIKDKFHPSGFNVGMNIGRAAGAGIRDHFHLHIVPRWDGDANFMPVVGKTRVLSYSIETIFEILLNEFKK
ncbi:MAG: HIT domain-containing protein [Candidatus Aminicenantes bacterium]|nr:HIT domain-containing protein [Candidatus Aminicenantes bacterium]NIM84591.1 HIT domain-containing protein [Candidatus Aminicenantes bacterium]NIN24113.1 HIT domain-containing protein [Candidatus Aminicenantes bacterium]NIN47819.1 HIT domain-containing protein [Candidatus Aminicenantes bacterium]NIN90757.1 HIT domain-containing protein [Candidatus Aminicenantes bacterium]